VRHIVDLGASAEVLDAQIWLAEVNEKIRAHLEDEEMSADFRLWKSRFIKSRRKLDKRRARTHTVSSDGGMGSR